MSLVHLLLVQAGPLVSPGAAPPIAPPSIEQPARRARHAAQSEAAPREQTQLEACMAEVEAAPASAQELAGNWRNAAQGSARAGAELCLGSALSALGRWDEAEDAFRAGRDDAAASDHLLRARLGAMAGSAALARGEKTRALAALDAAHADALAANDAGLRAEIALDQSRAFVALKRDDDASAALAEARAAAPANAEAWLLSATLSRRRGNLAQAQTQIERAAQLLPVDPEIGLEAGVIAVLSGREAAARKSWQSVIDAAPHSEAAATARSYLAQLAPPPQTGPQTGPQTKP